MSVADRHRRVAANFTALVDAVSADSWNDPTPVPEWTVRDIVAHLVEWPRQLLAGGAGVVLDDVAAVSDDAVAAWTAHSAQIQALIDHPGDHILSNPHMGEIPLAEAIDRFYTTDVLMHSWDLASATGAPHGLDASECAELLAGMEPLDQMLRDSGQYGPRIPVADDADPVDALIAFIGRDPAWRPGTA